METRRNILKAVFGACIGASGARLLVQHSPETVGTALAKTYHMLGEYKNIPEDELAKAASHAVHKDQGKATVAGFVVGSVAAWPFFK